MKIRRQPNHTNRSTYIYIYVTCEQLYSATGHLPFLFQQQFLFPPKWLHCLLNLRFVKVKSVWFDITRTKSKQFYLNNSLWHGNIFCTALVPTCNVKFIEMSLSINANASWPELPCRINRIRWSCVFIYLSQWEYPRIRRVEPCTNQGEGKETQERPLVRPERTSRAHWSETMTSFWRRW